MSIEIVCFLEIFCTDVQIFCYRSHDVHCFSVCSEPWFCCAKHIMYLSCPAVGRVTQKVGDELTSNFGNYICETVIDFSAHYKCTRCVGFRENWKVQFFPRDLVALSAQPVLVEPTHYTGQPGYVTDTEDSPIIDDDHVNKFKGDPGELSATKPSISVHNTEL